MLAQNFKSADDLGITIAEQQALIKVLGMLERGELIHIDYNDTRFCENGFNMSMQGKGCGTPACIGGWVAHLLGRNQFGYVDSYVPLENNVSGLTDLYWNDAAIYGCNSTEQAVIALRSYLTTGSANWEDAVR